MLLTLGEFTILDDEDAYNTEPGFEPGGRFSKDPKLFG